MDVVVQTVGDRDEAVRASAQGWQLNADEPVLLIECPLYLPVGILAPPRCSPPTSTIVQELPVMWFSRMRRMT